jgi:hypothetical protein
MKKKQGLLPFVVLQQVRQVLLRVQQLVQLLVQLQLWEQVLKQLLEQVLKQPFLLVLHLLKFDKVVHRH